MRTAICAAVLLLAVPALGADARPDAPPAPPPVAYEVWGFRWNGQQYVKEPANCLSTTDLKQAADYAAQITSYAAWSATTNMPEVCVIHTTYHGPVSTGAVPSAFPAKPTFSVRAFRQTDGKWVRDEQYSWTNTDPVQGLGYATRDTRRDWLDRDRQLPPVRAQRERFVDGGTVRGAEAYRNLPFQVCDAAYGPSPQAGYRRPTIP